MVEHRIVLDGSTTWPDDDAVRQRLHCTGCDLAGTIHIRPAAQLDALVAILREQHEGAPAGLAETEIPTSPTEGAAE